MLCPRCGDSNNEDSDRFCSACGQDLATYRRLWTENPTRVAPGAPASVHPVETPDVPASVHPVETPATAPTQTRAATPEADASRTDTPRIPSHLGWAAALVTVCWPAFWAGIPALVYAGRVESRLAAGDLDGAQEASQKARTWCWTTLWAGLVLWAIALTLVVTFLD